MDPKIERKLSALKEMAERGTEHEALVAAQKLQELCLKYGIESGELKDSESFSVQSIDSAAKMPRWKLVLATALAKGCGAYACQWYDRRQGLTFIKVYGLSYQQTAVATQYRHFIAIIDRLAKENAQGTAARNAYRLGMATALFAKLSPKQPQATESIQEEGLVLLSRSCERAKAFAEKKGGKISPVRAKCSNADAFWQGRRDGKDLNTATPLGNGYALPASR